MDLEKLQKLIRILEESQLSEIEMEEAGSRIRLQKPAAGGYYAPTAPPMLPQPGAIVESGGTSAPTPPVSEDDGLITINAPMVGVFYSSPSPGEDPFVKPGDHIIQDQTICIVEAMKLMNEVTAKFACEVVRVLVDNAEPVEYNQPLFAVRPLDAV